MIIITARPRTVVALTPPEALIYHGAGEGSNSATTPTFTPQANSILFIDGGICESDILPNPLGIANSAGLTFNEVIMATNDPGTGGRVRLSTWWAAIGSSPISMTATVSSNLGDLAVAAASSIRGASTDFSNVGSANSIVTAVSPSLPLFPANTSLVKAHALAFTFTGWQPVTGFTDLVDVGINGLGRFILTYNLQDADQSVAFTSISNNRRSIGIALEVKAAG